MNKMFTSSLAALVLFGIATLALPQDNRIRISEIEVQNENDGVGALEVEVHVFEDGTDVFLGCSGQLHGLRCVDGSAISYFVEAFIQKPSGNAYLTAGDVRGKNVYLEVIEDDENPCPAEPSCREIFRCDDLIGRSGTISGDVLSQQNLTLSFGNVSHCKIGAAASTTPNENPVRLFEIQLSELSPVDSGQVREAEIHLYDAATDFFLGCTGAAIDSANVLYQLDLPLAKSPCLFGNLTYDDVRERSIYVVVVEDTVVASCHSDLSVLSTAGRSQTFAGSHLNEPYTLQFGRVTRLTLGSINTSVLAPGEQGFARVIPAGSKLPQPVQSLNGDRIFSATTAERHAEGL